LDDIGGMSIFLRRRSLEVTYRDRTVGNRNSGRYEMVLGTIRGGKGLMILN